MHELFLIANLGTFVLLLAGLGIHLSGWTVGNADVTFSLTLSSRGHDLVAGVSSHYAAL